ncbi:hypothetical protein KM043_013861 [Ampulex compressa]|nr:hypothetical protein KM043_013861 [Ampulex compressa]
MFDIFHFTGQVSLEAEKTWLQYECERWGLKFNLESMSHQEESQSTPTLIHMPESLKLASSLGMIPENTLLESYTRLSISLEESDLFQASSRSSSNGSHHSRRVGMTLDELRAINRYAESTKSLTYLPQVHERQTARMRTRSEWFLRPVGKRLAAADSDPTAMHILDGSNCSSSGNIATGLSASAESVKRLNLYRTASKEKSRTHRSSSRRNKENGSKGLSMDGSKSRSLDTMKTKIVRVVVDQPKIFRHEHEVIQENDTRIFMPLESDIGPQDCTEMDVQAFHVTLTYKPRI